MAGIESEIRSFAAGPSSRWAIAHIWIIDGRQVIMMEQKPPGLRPKSWGLLCLSHSRQPWTAQPSSLSACQLVKQNTLQKSSQVYEKKKKNGDISTSEIQEVTKKICSVLYKCYSSNQRGLNVWQEYTPVWLCVCVCVWPGGPVTLYVVICMCLCDPLWMYMCSCVSVAV